MASIISSGRRTLLVFVVSVALQLPSFDRSVVSLDEGQLAAIGARMLSGDVLYRDIYTGIFPGVYWAAASVFAVFGVDVLALRVAQLVVNALTAAGLYLLVRPLAPGALAWAAPLGYLAMAVLSFPVFTLLSYSSLAMLAAIAAALASRRFIETAGVSWGLLVGVLLACSVISKQNYGAFALLATGVSALWARREGELARRSLLYAIALPAAGGLAVAALAATVLVASGAWPTFLEYTFFTLFKSQLEAFDQPFPPVFGAHPAGDGKFMFFYGPGGLFAAMFHGHGWANPGTLSMATRAGYGSAALALVLVPILAWRFGIHGDSRERVAARVALPLAGLMYFGIFPSAIWSHLASVYAPLLVVLVAAASAVAQALRGRSAMLGRAATAAGLLAVAPVAALSAAVALDIHRSYSHESTLPHVTLKLSGRDAALYEAADAFLRRCANDGEPVLVAPDMPLLYVTSARRNPTPYDLIIPGDVRDQVIVDRIDRAGVACMVFNPDMYVQFDSFEKLFPLLHAYMTRHFTESGSVSEQGTTWRFLRRKEPS
jgi:4-amino-4-deoxy-L-arabinose transferase-like glycosyltransferase